MKILIAIDRTEYAEIVLEHGLDQAARHPGAQLHIATVLEGTDLAEARTWLEGRVREARDAFDVAGAHTLHFRTGRPAPAIASLVGDLGIELLVIGRFHVPSAAEEVLATVDCPTMVVGIEGVDLEPQCPGCRVERIRSRGEHLFCEAHSSDRMLNLSGRLPPTDTIGSRVW